jgi:hypothetical protein
MMKKLLIYGPHAFMFFILGMMLMMYLNPKEESAVEEISPLTQTQEYIDVPADHWASAAVRWVSQTGIMTGSVDTGLFNPDGPVNRAGLATVSYRMYRQLANRLYEVEKKVEDAQFTHHFVVQLDAKQQSESIKSKAKGTALIIMNENGLWATVNAEQTSGKVTVATIRIGSTKTSEDATLLQLNVNGQQGAGAVTDLSKTDYDAILAGQAYISVSTSAYPNGEIAGHIGEQVDVTEPVVPATTGTGSQQ